MTLYLLRVGQVMVQNVIQLYFIFPRPRSSGLRQPVADPTSSLASCVVLLSLFAFLTISLFCISHANTLRATTERKTPPDTESTLDRTTPSTCPAAQAWSPRPTRGGLKPLSPSKHTSCVLLPLLVGLSFSSKTFAFFDSSDQCHFVQEHHEIDSSNLCPGGIFFGYDSGYINGVLGMNYFVTLYTGKDPNDPAFAKGGSDPKGFALPSWQKSLIVSILSAGTFFGALIAGDFADFVGRRTTVIIGCGIFIVGVILQVASSGYKLLVGGRVIAGLGIGFVSAIIILYMSEIAPKKVRGAIVSGYQFCITIGLLLAACVDYGTQNYSTTASYRIPIGLQMLWALILAIGLFFLPESPRYFVKRGNIDRAADVLGRLRGQPRDSEYVQTELAEIVANHEYELQVVPQGGYFRSWMNCFKGSVWSQKSNLRRTILGTSLQMMQQWTGINFIFYFGTTFFQQLGTINNPFLIGLITTLVNVCSTPISFYTIERFGRRTLLIWGAFGMLVCEFIVAIAGTADGKNPTTVKAEIAFICIYIFFFASTWGPGAWVVIGEVFPLPIRSRGVALSTASNWLWNCVRHTPIPSSQKSPLTTPPDHRRHNPLHGRLGPRQPRPQSLLRLGRPLRRLLRLRLHAHPRNQGPVPRTGRPHAGGDEPEEFGEVGAA